MKGLGFRDEVLPECVFFWRWLRHLQASNATRPADRFGPLPMRTSSLAGKIFLI
jgi:hypothetical protein